MDVDRFHPAGTGRERGSEQVSGAVLEMTGVVKDYRGLRPLRMERLALSPGDQVALAGMDAPAAEMMTTLVTGAAVPDAGAIQVLGTLTTTITTSDAWLRLVDRIGLVTDRAALLEMLTVVQNLAMSFTLDIQPPPDHVRRDAEALAAEVGLPESSWHQPVATLDGAQRIRLRLGRAVSLGPAFLLLEHPTAQVERAAIDALALDIRAVAQRRELTTLALTGDAEFAAAMDMRVMDWNPATGLLRERRRGRWHWRTGHG
jgi:simple sugar transport system ATP-binding protein